MLILLIYCISIIPKSVLSIIYHHFDVAIDEWWNKVVNVLESLFSNLGTPGCLVILYMRIFKRAFRSAGACKKNVVSPSKREHSDLDDDVNKAGCCVFAKKTNAENADEINSVSETNHNCRLRNNKVMRTANQKKRGIENKVAKVSAWRDNKERELKDIASRKKAAIITEAKTNARTQAFMDKKEKVMTQLTQAKTSAKRKFFRKNKTSDSEASNKYMTDLYCSECELSDSNNAISSSQKYLKCGNVLGSTTRADKTKTESKSCCQNTGGKLCCLCENRPLCLIIALSLANFHIYVYIVELFFIFCPWCK